MSRSCRVQHGELDAEVTVYDGTQLGQLQTGFNTMVAGLRELRASDSDRVGGAVRSVCPRRIDDQLRVRRFRPCGCLDDDHGGHHPATLDDLLANLIGLHTARPTAEIAALLAPGET